MAHGTGTRRWLGVLLALILVSAGCGRDATYSPSSQVDTGSGGGVDTGGGGEGEDTGGVGEDTGSVEEDADLLPDVRPDVPVPGEILLVVTPDRTRVQVGEVPAWRAVLLEDGEESDVTREVEWVVEPAGIGDWVAPGRLRARQPGEGRVTAIWAGELRAEAVLTVDPVEEADLVELVIVPDVIEIPRGFRSNVRALGVLSNGASLDLTGLARWESSRPEIATVAVGQGPGAVVQALEEGTAVILAEYEGFVAEAEVSVVPAALETIQVVPGSVTIPAGDASSLRALGSFADGELLDITATVTWRAQEPDLVQVTPGRVEGLRPGSTLVFAEAEGIEGQARVTVTDAQVLSLSVTPPTPRLAVGASQRVQASAVFSDNTALDVTSEATWTIEDPSVARIDGLGQIRITGLRSGTTTLRAIYGQVEATARITITEATLVALELAPSQVRVPVGEFAFLGLVGTYSDGDRAGLNASALWTSSEPDVALVGNAELGGLVTAQEPGEVQITASVEGLEATATVTVTEAEIVGIQITPPVASTPAGDSVGLNCFAIYSDNTLRGITGRVLWRSQDEDTATVSNDQGASGQVTGVAPGEVLIEAQHQGFTDTARVTVTDAVVANLFIVPGQPRVAVGRQLQANLLAIYSNGSTQIVTQEGVWSSQNPDIAQVSNAQQRRGQISGIAQGQAQIEATFGGQSAQTRVQVVDAEIARIFVVPQEVEASVGLSIQMVAFAQLSDGQTNLNVTGEAIWSTEDPDVATVSNFPSPPGRLTGAAPGQTRVTATVDGVTASATVRVIDRSVVSIEISPPNPALPVDVFQRLTAIAHFDDGTSADATVDATWESSETSVVATLFQPGLINTVGEGQALITARLGTHSDTTTVTVRDVLPERIVLAPVNPIVNLRGGGQGPPQVQFFATGLYPDDTSSDLTQLCEWTSSNPGSLLLFDELGLKGRGIALRAGSVQVTARCVGLESSTTVTIR